MGGITKNRLKEALRNIFRVRTWKLILILIPLLFIAATLLRFDHLEMVALRDQVIKADEEGSEEDILTALNQLKDFTLTHIVVNVYEENGVEKLSFGTGPFYLENQYVKKAQEELAKAEASLENAGVNPNGNVFKKAAEVCDALGIQYGWGYSAPYINCMQEELAKYPAMDEIEDYKEAMIPSTALYRQDFASPIWYPCWSGIIILVCIILIIVIFIRFLIWVCLRIALLFAKNH